MKITATRILSIHGIINLLPPYIVIKNRRVFSDEIMYFVECESTGGTWVVSVPRNADLDETVAAIKDQCLCGHGVSNFELEGCLECVCLQQ